MRNLWVGWLIMVASASASAEEPLLALNMQPQMMHTVDELLGQFSSEELSAAERIRLLGEGKASFSDGVTESGDIYFAHYEFVAERLLMRSRLKILPDVPRAEQAVRDILAGTRDGLQTHGVQLEEIANPPGSRYSGSHFLLLNQANQPFGSLSIIRRGANVYRVEVTGAVVSGSGAEMETFLSTKADPLLSFVPHFGEKSGLAVQKDRDRLQRQTRLFGWMIIYTLVYFTARGVVGLLNMTIRPRSLNGRTAGVLCIVALATSTAIYLQHIVVNSNPEAFARVDPIQQGQMIGQAIAEPAVPALFVLVAIGIASYIRNTRASATGDAAPLIRR